MKERVVQLFIIRSLKNKVFFFKILFVKTILTLVDGEDEIWMLENSLGIKNLSRLYICDKMNIK